MEIMPLIIEKMTTGTTMNFSKFRKMVPKGLMYESVKAAYCCKSRPKIMASTRAMPICAAKESFFFGALVASSCDMDVLSKKLIQQRNIISNLHNCGVQCCGLLTQSAVLVR